MAPQLTATNGRWRRGLAAWMARAAISFPVPDSPSMRTVESYGRHLLDQPVDGGDRRGSSGGQQNPVVSFGFVAWSIFCTARDSLALRTDAFDCLHDHSYLSREYLRRNRSRESVTRRALFADASRKSPNNFARAADGKRAREGIP